MIGVFPGTFDPPTVAHLAIAEAARDQCGLDRVDLVLSRDPLGKPGAAESLAHRHEVLQRVVATRPWLGAVISDKRHLADIAEGYDVLVLGADKWAQVLDAAFYDSADHRDEAVARLPRLAVAPRGDGPVPTDCVVLDVDMHHVSSSAVRGGQTELALPEALD